MKAWRRCYKILKRTGTLQIFMSFLLFLCGASFVLVLAEPAINTFGDGLWYCFVAATTIWWHKYLQGTHYKRHYLEILKALRAACEFQRKNHCKKSRKSNHYCQSKRLLFREKDNHCNKITSYFRSNSPILRYPGGKSPGR